MQEVLDLLSDNWTPANTSSTTPTFMKITDAKTYRFDSDGEILILAQRPRTEPTSAGAGRLHRRKEVTLPLDIRVLGQGSEALFLEAKEEMQRILGENMLNPTASFNELHPDINIEQDLSNSTKWLWRLIKEIKLIDYLEAR